MPITVEYKPWIEYPEIWATEAQWWSYLRGALRRGLWEKSPIKLSFKNENCSPPPENYQGRARSGAVCSLSGVWTGKSRLEVDHCEGNVSLLSWTDVLPFILHLVPPKGSIQLVDKEMHKIKSYAEKQGISLERARAEKTAIRLQKEKQDVQWLKENGIIPASNSAKRRVQIVERLMEEKENE